MARRAALASDSGPARGLTDPIVPGESYVTTLVFELPSDVRAPRLLIEDAAPVRRLVVGHEGSPGHGKILFARDGDGTQPHDE